MMKRILYFIGAAVILAIAAINVNLAVRSDFIANVSLANMIALARGESGIICATCGKDLDDCTCQGGGITCDFYCYNGAVCWFCDSFDPFTAKCERTGRQDLCRCKCP